MLGPIDVQSADEDGVGRGEAKRLETCDTAADWKLWDYAVKDSDGNVVEEMISAEDGEEVGAVELVEDRVEDLDREGEQAEVDVVRRAGGGHPSRPSR